MYRQLLMEKENQELKKQLQALKCELGLNKQNADLLAEQSGREKGGLRKKLVILSATFNQQSKQLQELSRNAQTRALKNASLRNSHNNNPRVGSCRKLESFVAGESFRSASNNIIAKKDSAPFLCQDIRLKDSTIKINRKTECVPTQNNKNGTFTKHHLESPSDKSKITKNLSTVPGFKSQDIRCQNNSLNIKLSTKTSDFKNASPSSTTNIIPKKLFPSSKANGISCQDVRLQDKSLKINRYVDIVKTATTTNNDKPPSYEDDAVICNNKVTATAHLTANAVESNINADNKELTNKSTNNNNNNNNKYLNEELTADWSDVSDEKIDYSIILDFGDDDADIPTNNNNNNNKYLNEEFTADWSDVFEEKIDYNIILDFGDDDE